MSATHTQPPRLIDQLVAIPAAPLSPHDRRVVADPTHVSSVMGPPNRAPGVGVMGHPDRSPRVDVMGGADRGVQLALMGGADSASRIDVMGQADPVFVDTLFTGRTAR